MDQYLIVIPNGLFDDMFGGPLSVNKKPNIKVPRDLRNELDSLLPMIQLHMGMTGAASFGRNSNQDISLALNAKKDSLSTYHFFGMTVDEDFDAVVPTPFGNVFVAKMFDRDVIREIWVKRNTNSSVSAADIERYMSSVPVEKARAMVTAVKMGRMFGEMRRFKENDTTTNDVLGLDPQGMANLMESTKVFDISAGGTSWDSLTLSLIEKQSREDSEVFGDGGLNLDSMFFGSLFEYWSTITPRYDLYYSFLCLLDSWQTLGSKLVGKEFMDRLAECIRPDPKNESLAQALDFSGIARSGANSEGSLLRSESSNFSKALANICFGKRMTVSEDDMAIDNIFLGMNGPEVASDTSNWFIPADRLQAMAILDGLTHTDDDAELAAQTYDMNDPDQVELLIRSSLKSYERKFSTFTPAEDYDLTDTLAREIIKLSAPDQLSQLEGQNIEDMNFNPVLDLTGVTDGEGPESSASEDLARATRSVADIKKVLKLIHKASLRVAKGFG